MKRHLLCAALALTLTLGTAAPAYAAEGADAKPGTAVVVNGVEQSAHTASWLDGATYVSCSGVTAALYPDAAAEREEDRLVVRAGDFTLSARVGSRYMEINGRPLYIPGGVRADESGDVLVPARTLAAALGVEIGWDDAVVYTSGEESAPMAAREYDAQVLDLLSRVITHESGNQSLEGKIAVGNVILHRVASPIFPGTVADVLYQKGQFPGATDCAANEESILAAKLCLEGADTAPGAYWFNGAGKACWASRNKAHIVTIGGHAFYG